MKLYFGLLFMCIVAIVSIKEVHGNNLVPLEWAIETEQFSKKDSVNILLSWERQGFSSTDGKCRLSNSFFITDLNSDYIIESKLQCHIDSIVINDKLVACDIDTKFWTDRKASTIIDIPNGTLRTGENEVVIFCERLAYTGGIGHNVFSISNKTDSLQREYVKVKIGNSDHQFSRMPMGIKIEYSSIMGGSLRVKIENSFHEKVYEKVLALTPSVSGIIDLSLEEVDNLQGFYQCMAIIDSQTHCGDVEWFAVDPKNIACDNHCAPLDFDEYWRNAKKELDRVPMCSNLIYVDSLSTEYRKAYIAEMQSVGDLTIRAYYFVPRKEGQYYAIIHLPGYGDGFENLDALKFDTTERIDMALCVRGHGISADVFNPGFDVPGIWGYGLYARDSIAYRSIYLDCVRAVDFLYSRQEVDKARIGVVGGSQGGGLALATAGLCNDRIAACAYFDPFPCDIAHQIEIRTICMQQISDYLNYYNNPCSFTDAMTVQNYIDTKYFAPYIKSKVFYATALFDDDCPPHVGFAAYNHIDSDKQYVIYPLDSHLGESNHKAEFMKWFETVFHTDNGGMHHK